MYCSERSTLPTAGSFQCKLKSIPSVPDVTEHLKKQGSALLFSVMVTTSSIIDVLHIFNIKILIFLLYNEI